MQVVGGSAPHAGLVADGTVLLSSGGGGVGVNTVVGGGTAVTGVEHVMIGRAAARPLLLARARRDVVQSGHRLGRGNGALRVDAGWKITLRHAPRTYRINHLSTENICRNRLF